MSKLQKFENRFETFLFQSRWLMAPFYLGLVIALVLLLIAFGRDLFDHAHVAIDGTPEDVILLVLSLIDLSLAGNLLLIMLFSGYENFVSKIDTGDDEDRPEWMGSVDFSGLKLKLLASIVAISGISLLKEFMSLAKTGTEVNERHLFWLLIIHLAFVGF